MAIAGVLVAVPQLQNGGMAKAATTAVSAPMRPMDITGSVVKPAPVPPAANQASRAAHTIRATHPRHRTYTVREGDTLASIAQHFYHKADDWQWLFHVNQHVLANPDSITVGQKLHVPFDPPAHYTLPARYLPKHAAPSQSSGGTTTTSSSSGSTGGSTDGSGSHSGGSLSGTLSCSGLEQLWEAAGGSPSEAVMAASIAMAESGGNQYAHSPSNDYGYWQINGSNGSLATYDAMGNARSAIILSHNGSDWSAWTTFTSGAYAGRC